MSVLDETLQDIKNHAELCERRVADICLTNYFTVLQLDDGSTGACMSLYHMRSGKADRVRTMLMNRLATDPLLIELLFKAGYARPLRSALQATLLGALSSQIIRAGGNDTFAVSSSSSQDICEGVRRAVVVGFGGYLSRIVSDPRVEEVYVADFAYRSDRLQIDRALDEYRARFPWKRITASVTADSFLKKKCIDLLSISGSALCNGTMDDLLTAATGCGRIIVQGQSASIHPAALFRRGVDLVVTTLKPRGLMNIARLRPDGEAMRAILEGGLPLVYLMPSQAATA